MRPGHVRRGRAAAQARARSSSARSSSRTRKAPSSPATARPQSTGRPTSTARAPSASATITSVPRRTPPSTSPRRRRRPPRPPRAERRGWPRPRPPAGRRDSRRPRRGAVIAGEPRVLAVRMPLTSSGTLDSGRELLDVAPAEGRVELLRHLRGRCRHGAADRRREAGHGVLRRHHEAGAQIPLAVAEPRRVAPSARAPRSPAPRPRRRRSASPHGRGRRTTWNQRRPPGAASATSAGVAVAIVDRHITVPARAAARAVAHSPSGFASRCSAVGATSTGSETGPPSTVAAVLTRPTSTSIRGRSRRRPERAAVVAERVLVAAPPA